VIRVILLSIVVCLSTVGGVYGGISWKASTAETANKSESPKVQIMKSPMVSVPILSDGEVIGYIVTRLQFTADTELLKGGSMPPAPFVGDEAFRLIFEQAPNDIKSSHNPALSKLSANIVAGVNKRLGRDVVKDILFESWTYVTKQDMMKKQ
jgi:flagellar basal body-associated protein FliL